MSTELWHNDFKDSHWIYAGGFSFDLTEGDMITVFSQFGEILDINLIRDKATGESKGFCFIAFQDQRSTILCADNLNGIKMMKLLDRKIRVSHAHYKGEFVKEGEEEEYREREREKLLNVVPAHLLPASIASKQKIKPEKIDEKLVKMQAQLADCDPLDPMMVILRTSIAKRERKLKDKRKAKDLKHLAKHSR